MHGKPTKKLKELETRAVEAEERCLDLERRAVSAEQERDMAQDMVKSLEAEILRLEEQITQTKAKITYLEEEIRQLQEELGETKVKLEEAEASGKEFEAKWNDAERRWQESEATVAELREVEAQLRATIQEQEEQIAKLEERLEEEIQAKLEERKAAAESMAKIEQLETEVAQLRKRIVSQEEEIEDLKRQLIPPEASDRKTQTVMTCSELDNVMLENADLKVMLEELKMKVKELMDKCKEEDMPEMAEFIEKVGLGPLLNSMSVFERLYLDAQERCVRLEELQRSYLAKMKERQESTLKWKLMDMEGVETSAHLSSAAAILSKVGEESTLLSQISHGQSEKGGMGRKEQRLPHLSRSPRASSEQGRTPRVSKRRALKEPSSDPLCPIRLPEMAGPAWKSSPSYSLL